MKKLYKPLTQINFFLTGLLLFMYASIRFIVVFLRVTPKGDESSFLTIFKIFIEKGFYEANVVGNSTFFNMITYVFYKISSNQLISLRLTSLFFGLLSLIILWFFYKKYFILPYNYRLVAFFTAINSMVIMSWIFTGYNDVILAFLTVILFYFIYKLKTIQKESNFLYLLIGLVMGLMLLTRLMSILFYPSLAFVLISIFYIKKKPIREVIKKISLILTSFVVVILLFNIPSLIEKGELSFQSKEIKTKGVNWTQRQYLTTIGLEKGEIPFGQHYKIKEVRNYLDKNGENSLPKTLVESIFFDFRLTVKQFFYDFFYEIKPFTRLLGLFFIINLLLFVRYLYKHQFNHKNILNQHIFLFSLIYILIICFIIITYVENRWFSNIFLLLPIVFVEQILKFKKENCLGKKFDFFMINLQLLSLTIMSMPYLIKNIGILF